MQFHILQNQESTFRYENNLYLLFSLGGVSSVLIGETVFPLRQEGLMAVNPCTLYRLDCLEGSLLLLAIPDSELREAGIRRTDSISCYTETGADPHPDYDRLRRLLAVLFYTHLQQAAGKPAGEDALREPLQQLLVLLRERFCTPAQPMRPRPQDGEKAASILAHIDRHWDEDLSLAILAEREHFSISYLSRFFQRVLGIRFSVCLRKIRMIHARQMLLAGEDSVTRIGYDCGFHNSSVFIEAFREEYGITPGQFRLSHASLPGQDAEIRASERDQRSDFSVLLSYMPEDTANKTGLRKERIELSRKDLTGPGDHEKRTASGPFCERMLNIGYAKEGLLAPVQEQIRQACREIGFTWFRCHGILDPDMQLYHEDAEGRPFYSFAYVDALLDFVTETGLRPFIELSFMPPQLALRQTMIFDRPSTISGCADLGKWRTLILALLSHLRERYGAEALRTWRFSTISLSYVRVGCLRKKEFAELYLASYRTVKEFDPLLSFGGAGYFSDLIENDEIGAPWFLRFAVSNGCPPNFHSMQYYPCIQTDDQLFLDYTINQSSAPALLSTDPDYLTDRLDRLAELFRRFHLEDRELFLEECNSTLWQRDLSADTCYKAVWMAHNLLQSAGRAVFGYWLLTDFMEERTGIRGIFHGGYGLFTCNGLPKAGYFSLSMLGKLEPQLLAQGNGWVLTGRQKGPGHSSGSLPFPLTLLVYNYCHYNDLNCYRYKQLEAPSDAYSVFQAGEKTDLTFDLRGLPSGLLKITRTRLTKEHGSSFDGWLRLRAPEWPSADEIRFLQEHTHPEERMEILPVSGEICLRSELLPLEMELIKMDFLPSEE